jgi:hypothetical protein
MAVTALAGAILTGHYVFSNIIDTESFVVTVIPRSFNVVSNITLICDSNMSSFVCYFEKSTNVLILFLRQQQKFDCLNVAV